MSCSDAELDSGAMSLASSDQFDQQIALELDVQAFQQEEVAIMQVAATSTRAAQPQHVNAKDGEPLGQATV